MPKLKKKSTKDLEQEIGNLTEALQRERADAINLRTRAEKERGQMADLFKASTVRNLLPALDSLQRAIAHTPKELLATEYFKGIQNVSRQFEKNLADMGVERIKTVGEHFDPGLHEAVSVEDGKGGNEIIIEELQTGYKLGNEIIRHAMVKVKRSK